MQNPSIDIPEAIAERISGTNPDVIIPDAINERIGVNPNATIPELPDTSRINFEREEENPSTEDLHQEQAPSSSQETMPESGFTKFIYLAKKYAAIIDSRESLTRMFLDLTAFDIPTVAAAVTRNWKAFFEACYEAVVSTVSLWVAPPMTKLMAKFASNFTLDKEHREHYDKLVRLYRHELKNENDLQKGVQRILDEEPKDLERVGKLYKDIDKEDKYQLYQQKSQDLKEFFSSNQTLPSLKSLANFKDAVIVAESFFESIMWGSFGLSLRWLRKNVLKQDSFTGTKEYTNEEEAKKLGEAKPLSTTQKIFGTLAMFLSPVMNSVLIMLMRNKERLEKSKFWQMLDKNLDMTHGLFPKLGLLFSYTTIPKWFGTLSTVQGKDELIERILKLFTVIPSWWLGHRVTNGKIAAYHDKKLAEKHNVDRGILVEPKYIGKFAPDAARIHHVLDRTEGNPKLEEDARDRHAKTLYSGISLHSLGVLLIALLIQKFTKWRVTRKLGKS